MRIKEIRKAMCLLLSILVMMLFLPGCGGQQDAVEEESMEAEEQLTEDQTAADQQVSAGQPDGYEAIDISSLGGDGVDVDLSKLSTTMVYSVVYDMMMRPNEYIGKTIRMSGAMSNYYDEDTGITYYACIIQDATACCSQGIEFQTTDEFDPADYPADGEPVTVSGRYDLYEENGAQYCVLKDAVLE